MALLNGSRTMRLGLSHIAACDLALRERMVFSPSWGNFFIMVIVVD